MGTYLITGVAGFIGSRVAELILADGHTVVGIDNLNNAYDKRLKQWRLHRIQNSPHFVFHRLDVTDRRSLLNLGPGSDHFDAVINLAARAGVRYSVENPWAYYETNVTGTLNLLDFCHHNGVNKFVLASSSSVYGDSPTVSYHEDLHTDRPLSPYASSKKAAELLCYNYHYLYDIDVTVLRYFTVYGPAGRPDMMLFRAVQWINEGRTVTVYGDGRQSRDFTYIDDIARGTISGLRPVGYEIINLGCDAPVVLMDCIQYVEKILGRKADIKFEKEHAADVRATRADIRKAERILLWRPTVSYQDGIGELVSWYLENRDWAKNIST